ncbi:MAG TPA: hypothetical protein VFU36_15875 [Jatrophihabitans sp.]|nr:hypothetical protein [Jatrophihabitans sp.]
MIALEEFPGNEAIAQVVGTIALTVLFSVVLHGVTADAWAARYGDWARRTRPEAELGAAVQPLAGRGIRRRGLVLTPRWPGSSVSRSPVRLGRDRHRPLLRG